jgi:pyruvate formate lyase activating enzyme
MKNLESEQPQNTGMLFDIKRYAIHDGPGIRTTVFLKGCLLNCPWCHNPEGKVEEEEFMWWKEKCLGCRDCQNACTRKAISFSHDSMLLERAKCDLCGACTDACYSEALKLVGKKMTVAQVMKEIEKDVPFYEESKGGVTLSGGEPLLQPDFSLGVLKASRELGIHTAVDTCGHADWNVLSRMSEHVDLFLYDLKLIDDQKHTKFTGVSNELILENVTKLSRNGQRIIVRIPLVAGVNDDEKDVSELGKFVCSLEGVKDLSILPYHKAGIEKSRRLGRSMDLSITNHPPSPERLTEIVKELENFGLRVQIGG